MRSLRLRLGRRLMLRGGEANDGESLPEAPASDSMPLYLARAQRGGQKCAKSADRRQLFGTFGVTPEGVPPFFASSRLFSSRIVTRNVFRVA